MTKLARKRMLVRIRQARYRAKHRERINAARRLTYDPVARRERYLDEYQPKRGRRT